MNTWGGKTTRVEKMWWGETNHFSVGSMFVHDGGSHLGKGYVRARQLE